MQFIPYLNFNGNCAEAMAFYAQLFGGTIVHQSTFGETPGFEQMPEAGKRCIMHAHLQIKDQALMASDATDNCGGGGYQPAQGMWISIAVDDVAEGRRVFGALAEGGRVAMPFDATFWSPGFGMVTDRFNTPWMVNVRAAA
jgi:PhnB protein